MTIILKRTRPEGHYLEQCTHDTHWTPCLDFPDQESVDAFIADSLVIRDQPAPIPNDSIPVWDLVLQDMMERDKTGRGRYGTPLQVENGRDHLVDAYQEALDLVVYLRAEIERRAGAPR